MSDEFEEPRKGVFGRIYARHAARGSKIRGGRDEDRAHDRGRTAGRGGRGSGADLERDAELQMRADAMMVPLRKTVDSLNETIAALRERIAALPQSIEALDSLLRDSLTRAADGMWGVPERLSTDLEAIAARAEMHELDALEKPGALDDDLLTRLTLLEPKLVGIEPALTEVDGEVDELEEAITVATRELNKPRVQAALKWGESFEAVQLVPTIKNELHGLGEALGEGYPVDLPAIVRFCDVIEGYQSDALAATSALALLKGERDTKLPAARDTLKWFKEATARELAGPVVDAMAGVEAAQIDTLSAATFDPEARAAIQRDIDALAAWAGVVDGGLRKDKYCKDILGACNDKFPFLTADGSKPPFDTPETMAVAFLAAVLDLPVNGGNINQTLVRAKACPGRWMHFIRQDATFAKELQDAQARAVKVAAVSTHLQNGAGWALAAANADVLAERLFGADEGALAKLQSSGLTQVTWNRLAAKVPRVFATFAGIFEAIDRLGTEAALSTFATQRLPYLALTAGNLNTILASGAARLDDPRGYPYPSTPVSGMTTTIGASVVVEWNGWMPGGVKAHAWGAVHFHFNGQDVQSTLSKVHLKDYELHTAGGMGKVKIGKNSAGAQLALAPILAADFEL